MYGRFLLARDGGDGFGHLQRVRFALDDARPGDEEAVGRRRWRRRRLGRTLIQRASECCTLLVVSGSSSLLRLRLRRGLALRLAGARSERLTNAGTADAAPAAST